jgi:peptidoglycan hydrolase-like protein with peptidoglycan-binding domain
MGDFYKSIKDELDALEEPFNKDYGKFGADYDSNPTVVKAAQSKINSEGYSPALTTDGIYGPNTKAGIEWYQQKHGLSVDGVLGPQTAGSMGITAPAGGAPTGGSSSSVDTSEFAALVTFSQKYTQTITQGTGLAPGFSGTRASVVNSFVDWSTPFEGYTDYPYTDAHGLVTTGMGNLIDSGSVGDGCGAGTTTPCGSSSPTAAALALPWSGDISADWAAIKAAWPGVQSTADAGITSARLSKDAVVALVTEKLKTNDQYLVSNMTGFAAAPADAQLAVHSMSWAMGPSFAKSWPAFDAAFNSGDYVTAADQSHMQGVGIDMRNLANKLLLTNAAAVKAKKLNYDHLYYLEGLTALMGTAAPLALMGQISSIGASIKAHPYRTGGIVAATVGLIWGAVKVFGGPK